MPRHLHYDGERFAYWSTVVDAYVTYPSDIDGVRQDARDEWGSSFMKIDFAPHLKRALDHGCSAYPPFRCEELPPFEERPPSEERN
jgi:hypothetical protein